MARIFISHSCTDNPQVAALADWLRGEGWDDLFIDWDPERGLVAGDRWGPVLQAAMERCELVICLVSQAWLDSKWCRGEFSKADHFGKKIMPLLLEHIPNDELPRAFTDNWQLINLVGGRDHLSFPGRMPDGSQEQSVSFSRTALIQLKNGLKKAGLGPRDTFLWPPANERGRPPYRGMRPLEAEDAGIFFGRDASIYDLLGQLRALGKTAPPRLLVILGASGAGKSSFLRAGILPRLQRDEENFLPLPVIRPESKVVSGEKGLLAALEEAFIRQEKPVSRRALREELAGGGAGAILTRLVAQARETNAGGEAPAVVLSIDQGEELFLGEGVEESRTFLALLKDLLTADRPALIALVTIRSDAYERLQAARELEGIDQKPFSLPPMPRRSYPMVIEGPIARLAASSQTPLTIEPQLTQALLEDIDKGEGKDALPLLAFTLERLYFDLRGEGVLQAAHYQELNAIGGAIEAAAADALACAEKDSRLPRDTVHRLLRQAFVPWLAGMDPDSKMPRRRVARQEDIPPASLPLLRCFVKQRLLSTDVDQAGAPTIEPAHEALLRQWGLLHGWLQEDAALLFRLDGVQRAAREWQAHGGDDGAWLVHSGSRLKEAEGLRAREDLARFLSQTDQAYLQGCCEEEGRREKALEDARELAQSRDHAERKAREAEQARDQAIQARTQAEDLVNHMLFDLRDKLEPVGRLDLLAMTARKALAYYQQFGRAEGLSPEQQRNLSAGMNNLGDVLVEQGDLPGALASYRADMEIVERLSYMDGKNALWQRNLSVSHNKIGDVLQAQGDLARALASYRAGLEIRGRLAAMDGNNAGWQRDLSLSHERIGDVLKAQGDLAGALASYRAGLEIAERLAAMDGNNAGWQRDLSVSHLKIGEVLQAQGDLAGALASYRAGLEITERLAAMDGNDADRQRDLSVSHNLVGDVLEAQGDLAGALASYRAGLEITERLAAMDGDNAGWQRDLSLSHERIGTVLQAQGDVAGALASYRAGLEIAERLAALDGNNAFWKRDLSVSHERIGTVLQAQGDLAGALASYRAGLEIRGRLAALDGNNAGWQRDLAVSHEKMGLVLEWLGRSQEAIAHFAAAIGIVEAVFAKFPGQRPFPFDLSVDYGMLGRSFLQVGQFAEAQRASAKARELSPGELSWVVNLGHAHLLQGEGDKAYGFYREAMPLIKDKGQLEKVLSDFRTFMEKGWKVEESRAAMAWVREAAGPLGGP